MDELIEQFAVEARELVQQASADLLALDADPNDRARLEGAFRAIHTLKGSVGLFDLGPMQAVLHQAEDLLAQERDATAAVDGAMIDILLSVVAFVDDNLDDIGRTGRLSEVQANQAQRLLKLLKGERTAPETGKGAGAVSRAVPEWALSLRQRLPPSALAQSFVAIRYEPHPECFFNGDDPLATISRVRELRHLSLSLKNPQPSTQDYDPFRCHLIIEAISGGSAGDVESLFRLIPDQVQLHAFSGSAPAPERVDKELDRRVDRQPTTMRVDPSRIDKLIEIAGELVMAKNALAPLANDAQYGGNKALARSIASSHHEIDRLVSSLYSAVTQARMIPLEQTFRRFPRLVRETSARLGKAVDLVIEGGSVEADREIVESLFDPLLHLIRNGLDHGIEPEAGRLQASKSARGRLLLRAQKIGDQVEIEVTDDGAGIDPQRVKATAVDRGILSADQASTLSDKDILQLVFSPGFSTTSSVSDLSGRGVGLDVVRQSIHQLGGSFELQSIVGSGTTFVLRLPISFSMAQLMVVEVGGERYAIPLEDVVETHRLAATMVQSIRAGHAFILRDRTIPLLFLAELLNIPMPTSPLRDLKVLIVRAERDEVALVVDAIAERVQTLTRPLTGFLEGFAGISGTTLLGDGRILLVLNVEELLP